MTDRQERKVPTYSGIAMALSLVLGGCYTVTPDLILLADAKNVNPRQEKLELKEDEKNPVLLRVFYLTETKNFLIATDAKLWPGGSNPDFKAVLGEELLHAEDAFMLDPATHPDRFVIALSKKKDDKPLAFKHVGVAANFADKTGDWRLCLSRSELAKYRVVIKGNNLEKKEIDTDEAQRSRK